MKQAHLAESTEAKLVADLDLAVRELGIGELKQVSGGSGGLFAIPNIATALFAIPTISSAMMVPQKDGAIRLL